jgi:hypothetical protein
VLALRGRVAWAHDWVSDPTLAACMNRGNRIAKRPVPRSKSGHIMIEDAQEERFSDVVAIAYSP